MSLRSWHNWVWGLGLLVSCVTAPNITPTPTPPTSAPTSTPFAASFTPASTLAPSPPVSQLTLTFRATPVLMFDGQSPGPTVKVSVNATVRVVLTNADTVQHDWWLVEGNERAPYIASAFKGAKTKIIESNTKEEIVFTAERVGVFKYVCTVPGHEQTMFGAFIVEGGQ